MSDSSLEQLLCARRIALVDFDGRKFLECPGVIRHESDFLPKLFCCTIELALLLRQNTAIIMRIGQRTVFAGLRKLLIRFLEVTECKVCPAEKQV